MRQVRVLVVDDAVVIRRILTDILSEDSALQVVAACPSGKIAIQRIPQLNPDIVVLDVEMPEMNGIETLAEIKKSYPKMPVIMYSALTGRGASATLDALALGATDYVLKPTNAATAEMAAASVRGELTPKVKYFGAKGAGINLPHAEQKSQGAMQVVASKYPGPKTTILDIVAIGVSTGGPNALAEVLPLFSADFPLPIVIVQHMPPVFTSYLAERLQAKSKIKIKEGAEGDVLRPGFAYIAPGGFHMCIRRRGDDCVIEINSNPPENSCRPAVDVMFRSVAEAFRGHSLAVILTGMGQDGLRGCELIAEQGGQVVAQDEVSSVVWGMPGFVVKAGLADVVLPLVDIGGEITKRANMYARAVIRH